MLPAICPDKLPGGYKELGLIFEQGKELPVGLSSRQRLGFEQVGINCALCHTGSYQDSPEGPPHVVLGMPANRLEPRRLVRFVIGCMLDDRFTADNVIGHLERAGKPLGAIDRMLYRVQVIPRLREVALQTRSQVGLADRPGSA